MNAIINRNNQQNHQQGNPPVMINQEILCLNIKQLLMTTSLETTKAFTKCKTRSVFLSTLSVNARFSDWLYYALSILLQIVSSVAECTGGRFFAFSNSPALTGAQ